MVFSFFWKSVENRFRPLFWGDLDLPNSKKIVKTHQNSKNSVKHQKNYLLTVSRKSFLWPSLKNQENSRKMHEELNKREYAIRKSLTSSLQNSIGRPHTTPPWGDNGLSLKYKPFDVFFASRESNYFFSFVMSPTSYIWLSYVVPSCVCLSLL